MTRGRTKPEEDVNIKRKRPPKDNDGEGTPEAHHTPTTKPDVITSVKQKKRARRLDAATRPSATCDLNSTRLADNTDATTSDEPVGADHAGAGNNHLHIFSRRTNAEEPADSGQPPPGWGDGVEEDEEGDEGEGGMQYIDDEDEFDPYLFIKTLPPLEECVPSNRTALLPPKTRRTPLVTLVLDLDETLVHSTLGEDPSEGDPSSSGSDGAPGNQYPIDFSFPMRFENQEHAVNVRQRPGLHAFMEAVAKKFEVVVFTASQRVYAEQLLNILDPTHKLIRHRIYRDSCVIVDGNYLKDLSVLGRDMQHVVIVDNSPQAFGFQVDNGIPIESWFGDRDDQELTRLQSFLEKLVDVRDVRPKIARQYKLRERVASLVDPDAL